MKRKIINIAQDKCNGCGLCVSACHEGAIGMVDGKAKLMREDYCDGLGDCLPVCPTGAITFIEKDAPAFDEAAVKAAQAAKQESPSGQNVPCGCPGMQSKHFAKKESIIENSYNDFSLINWPLQIKLAPINASFFDGADLVIAADCTAFACGNIHKLTQNKVTLIGCPKLDEGEYSEKLTEILKGNDIKSVTVIRMEVPCCGGLTYAVQKALQDCGKDIRLNIITIGIDGKSI
ncbi:NAD-dependent dihydropyrimidine dehydrogenase PreA subunit [Elusimicrobium simillimum]|uniref:ATP-binding protein n=1 Tax=Elusimicrobium simillimum TaxID=3143438 RepID=UPI003C6EAEBD